MMDQNWFQRSVAYQIYPKSFYDSNGDGVGDLKGVLQKLDYLQALGVDLLWLSPVYCSPMADNGYDISDYYHVEPSMGTDEELDELIARAGERGMKVMMDMVVNHCSDQHPWFRSALADPEGPYGRYFYFRKGRNGQPPNNWRCWFGGSAWEPVPGTEWFYLHTFTRQQPDLNWENAALREEMYRVMNYWLEKGVAGFRMDAITDLKKRPTEESLPPDKEDGLAAVARWTENVPGIGDFLTEMRERTYGRVNAVTVGEADGVVTRENLMEYISLQRGYFSMIFDFCVRRINAGFYWCDTLSWTPEDFKARLSRSCEKAGDEGWMGIVLENHDQPRCIDHFLPTEGQNDTGASMLALMQLMRRGTPFIYQGQEIGMRNVGWMDMSLYDDPSSHSQYGEARRRGFSHEEAMRYIHGMSRDNARTPFQWNNDPQAGFTTGKPWLPVHENYSSVNAAVQENNPASLLNWYRKLIAFRRFSEWADVLALGSETHFPDLGKNVLCYLRQYRDRRLMVVCNFQAAETECVLPAASAEVLLSNLPAPQLHETLLRLRPFEAIVLKI